MFAHRGEAAKTVPDLIYLDCNCFQRGFDDPRQIRIRMEALACEAVFAEAEEGTDGRTKVAMQIMDDVETRANGILALNKALGPTAALRFLTLLCREPTDYVAISRRFYEGQAVDDIFERARKAWKAA